MKISKKLLLIIAIGIFVVALYSLFRAYSGQTSEQKQLEEQLASLRTRLGAIQLEPLTARQAELEAQLSQATPELESAKALLSQPAGSVNVTAVLFDLAQTYNVEVTQLTSPGTTTEKREGVTFSVISLTATVQGKVDNLVGFVTKLNSYFATGAVKSVVITTPEATVSDNVSAVMETTTSDNVSGTSDNTSITSDNASTIIEITSSDNVSSVLATTSSDNLSSVAIELAVYFYQGD